jgi:hypothetical protein
LREKDESDLKDRIREYQVRGRPSYEIMEILGISREKYNKLVNERREEIARDYIENAPEKKAQAIIDLNDSIILQMEMWDQLVTSPKSTDKQRERAKRGKKKAFVDMIRMHGKMSMDYTCKEENRALEKRSKALILRAMEYRQRLNKEPAERVIESFMKENQRGK